LGSCILSTRKTGGITFQLSTFFGGVVVSSGI
jgi:hypothetical protein